MFLLVKMHLKSAILPAHSLHFMSMFMLRATLATAKFIVHSRRNNRTYQINVMMMMYCTSFTLLVILMSRTIQACRGCRSHRDVYRQAQLSSDVSGDTHEPFVVGTMNVCDDGDFNKNR